jgi:hypothetical protein
MSYSERVKAVAAGLAKTLKLGAESAWRPSSLKSAGRFSARNAGFNTDHWRLWLPFRARLRARQRSGARAVTSNFDVLRSAANWGGR